MSAHQEAATGLDLFAAAWIERWRSFGGYVFVDRETGKASLGMPMPGIGGHADIEGDGWQHTWNEGFDTGRWRELETLLRCVPGGSDALAAHVLNFPDAMDSRLAQA